MTESSKDDVRWKQRLQSFSAALRQLAKAVALRCTRDLSELEQLGLIQAFEFTHEMAWKVMKDRYAQLFTQFEEKMLEIAGRADA
jgi:hypothetical protein